MFPSPEAFMILFTAVLSLILMTVYSGIVWSMSLEPKNTSRAVKVLCVTSAFAALFGAAALVTLNPVLMVLFGLTALMVWVCVVVCLPIFF